jgi:DUF4097 and DUF4098 domain-containing protein YvlB
MSEERLMILKMIQDGKITPEQGENLLKALPPDQAPDNRATIPTPQAPPPPIPPMGSGLGSFFDLQGRLADLQVKLGEVQTKLGAATSSSSTASGSSGKGTSLPFGLGDVNVGQMIDEAVRGVNSLKSESVKTFKQAARSAQKEGQKIRQEAKKSGKNIRIELNINFDDDGRPRNDTGQAEHTFTEEVPLSLHDGRILKIVNRIGDVKISSGTGTEPLLKFTRTTWCDDLDKLARLDAVRPVVVSDPSGQVEQILVDAESADDDHITIDLELTLPEEIAPSVESTFGKVSCENRSSSIGRFETQTGDIRLLNIRGEKTSEGTIRTRSGGIAINQWDGPSVAAESVSGRLALDGVVSDSASFRSRSGELLLSNLHVGHNLTVESASGDVELRNANVGQSVAVRTQSGDVSIDSIRAAGVKVESVSGDLSLTGISAVDGGVTFKSVSGDIVAKLLQTVVLSSSSISGDIDLSFAAPFTGNLNASTISGDLSVKLLQDSDARVEMSTQSGSIESILQLDQQVINGTRFMSGTLATGHGNITLQSVSGDVTVKPQA